MAKKKIEYEIEDELEDKDLENQDADDEIDDDEEDEGDEKPENKDSENDGDSSLSEEDEEDQDATDKKESDAEREAIRERRRREKKMKRERDRRERSQLQNTIIMMAEEIKKLKDGQGEVGKKFEGLTRSQIESEIGELSDIYNRAQAAMESAVAEGDGKKFTQAKAISDKAWARYTFLEAQKRQRLNPTTDDRQDKSFSGSSNQNNDNSVDGASEVVQLGRDGKRYGIAFVKENKSWYDPSGGNRDSKIVLAIDSDLYNEGYDPETKEYWDELKDRCKEYLPHRFKAAGTKPRPKSVVGGSGNDYSSAGGAEKSLPKEFVQTLKAAGYWDDAAKRKAAIKNYYANRKGA